MGMRGGEGVRRNKMDGVRGPGECIEINKGGYVFKWTVVHIVWVVQVSACLVGLLLAGGMEGTMSYLKAMKKMLYIIMQSNLRPNVLRAPYHPPGCRHVSSLGCRERAVSIPLRFLVSPTTTSSDAVSERVARDPCMLFWRAIRVHSIGIECRQHLVSCAETAAGRSLREHLLLRAGQGIMGG